MAWLSGPPAQLKVPGPHLRRRWLAPEVRSPAPQSGDGGFTRWANAWPLAGVLSVCYCPRAQHPNAAVAAAVGSGRQSCPPGRLRASWEVCGGSGSGAVRQPRRRQRHLWRLHKQHHTFTHSQGAEPEQSKTATRRLLVIILRSGRGLPRAPVLLGNPLGQNQLAGTAAKLKIQPNPTEVQLQECGRGLAGPGPRHPKEVPSL